MGTTTNYAIPYPEPTDFVTDGAQAMENIAEQVDAVLQAGTVARNILYNGAMRIAQRNTSVAGITAGGYYTLDRWYMDLNTLGTWTMAQTTSSGADDFPGAVSGTFSGFRASAKLTMTSTVPTLGAGSGCQLRQLLEGQDLQMIRKGKANAQPVTISFWVKSSKSGTYVLELFDGDNNRQVSKSYVVNATGTWEYKTVTFPADTTGMFDNDNAVSLYVIWWLAAGSTFTSGTLNTSWASVTSGNRAVGQVNVADTQNAYWQVTGMQMTVGTVAPPFQFKPLHQELAECQRYYEKSYNLSVVPSTNTGNASVYSGQSSDQYGNFCYKLSFLVRKRATPTVTFYTNAGTAGSWTYLRNGVGDTNTVMNWTNDWRGETGGLVFGGVGASYVVCVFYGQWVADSELT